jgi:hypothetical protein
VSNATQAPATAGGPIQHTQNQAPRYTPVQLRMLHKGIERKPMPFEEFLDALIGRATAANRERNAA